MKAEVRMKIKLTGKKFLLILLFSPTKNQDINVPIYGRTRLMKMGFLFKEELKDDFQKDKNIDEIALPEFFAWKYGPFSREYLNDLEFLINQEFIHVDLCIGGNPPIPAELAEYKYWMDDIEEFQSIEYEEERFSLTEEKGMAKANEFWKILSNSQKELIIRFKTVLNNVSLDRILEYVYKKYEEKGYINKSLIRDKYLT